MRGIKRRTVKPFKCKNCNKELFNASSKYCNWECARRTRINHKPKLKVLDLKLIKSNEFKLKQCKVCENVFPLTRLNRKYCCSSCEYFFNYHKNPELARAKANLNRKKNPVRTKEISTKSRLKRINKALKECREWHKTRKEKGLPLRDDYGKLILKEWKIKNKKITNEALK